MTATGAGSITAEQFQKAQSVASSIVDQAEAWKKALGSYHTEYDYHDKSKNYPFTSYADKLYVSLGATALGQITTDPDLITGSARYFGNFLAAVLFSDKNAHLFQQKDFDRQAESFVYHDNSVNALPNRSIRETYTGLLNGALSFS